MNFTQEQISEILFGIAKSNDGMQLLMKMTLESIMKVERELHQEQNVLRLRSARQFNLKM